jgi:hypothetical protein
MLFVRDLMTGYGHLKGKSRRKLRLYSPSRMTDAYIAATGKEKLSIRKAAQRFGVPFQTL